VSRRPLSWLLCFRLSRECPRPPLLSSPSHIFRRRDNSLRLNEPPSVIVGSSRFSASTGGDGAALVGTVVVISEPYFCRSTAGRSVGSCNRLSRTRSRRSCDV